MNGDGTMFSESVTEGHPDKVMDQVADAILDHILTQTDKHKKNPAKVRVAVEGLAKGTAAGGTVCLAGEVTVPQGVSPRYEDIVRQVLEDIGYTDPAAGFWHQFPRFHLYISTQSSDIAAGVGDAVGAGDQGLFFGYATNEDPSGMPLPIQISHALTAEMTALRKSGRLPWLRPDGKSQVGIEYKNGKPQAVVHVTLAVSHTPDTALADARRTLCQEVILPVLERYHVGINIREKDYLKGKGAVIINGAGPWIHAYGPLADTGVVGRKIIVDTYGGAVPHGGGALSGKDPTKVDRSALYAARFIANNLVHEGYADRVQIGLSYTIGKSHPNGMTIQTFGTEHTSGAALHRRAAEILDLRVEGFINQLRLFAFRQYRETARNGHFGHPEFPWEHLVSDSD